jgi:ADP-ribosylglycohydrolase
MSSSRDRVIDRARACFVGLIAGDCLGSIVDGMKPQVAARIFPDGPRMKDASKIGLLPGQPTAVAEMAIVLARKLARYGSYNRKLAAEIYRRWIDTEPFRLEKDLAEVLAERAESAKPTGSVLARCVPIAVMSVRLHGDIRLTSVVEWIKEEMSLTHPDKECADVAAIFACMLSDSVEYGARGESLVTLAVRYGRMLEVEEDVLATVRYSTSDSNLESMPKGPLKSLCCVLRCAARVKNPEKAVVAALTTTDQPSIHAAAVGALVGARHGLAGLPEAWGKNLSICRPKQGQPQVRQPRPRDYWPADIHSLAASLS